MKLTPAPPAGTFATDGVGPGADGDPAAHARGRTGRRSLTATLLFTFSVTVTVPPWMTKLLPTDIAVSRQAGRRSCPGTAAIGTYGPIRAALADRGRRGGQTRRVRVDHP